MSGRVKAKSGRSTSSSTRGRSRGAGGARPAGLEGLGPFSLRILKSAGIRCRADLDRIGPVAAYVAAKKLDPKVTLNLLWGLAGAYSNTHWAKLPAEYRASLLREYDACCDQQSRLGASSSD